MCKAHTVENDLGNWVLLVNDDKSQTIWLKIDYTTEVKLHAYWYQRVNGPFQVLQQKGILALLFKFEYG